MKIIGKFPYNRLRRTRNSDWVRRLVSESSLSRNDLILPLFIKEGKKNVEPIKSMPGVFRYTLDKINEKIDEAEKLNIPMVAIFPYTPKKKKDKNGSEALNKNNLVCKALRLIKNKKRNIGIMCDVALDPYTSHGHDGILKEKEILNDQTIKILSKQAIIQAQMGCDVIAPSDMMDGRVGVIRKALDKHNFQNVQILSYAAKYSSNFYGPFREAIGSKKKLKGRPEDAFQP